MRFIPWAKSKGMDISPSAPYAHEQNGISEFTGHYITQLARTVMIASNAPPELWTEAANAVTFIINRLKNQHDQAPIDTWREDHGRRGHPNASLDFLRTWYAKAYVHIPKEKRIQARKMDPRAWIGHLVGYDSDGGYIYRIYNP